jgi:hypothetical protein
MAIQVTMVTSSARLETFRQSGDSLAGRWRHQYLDGMIHEDILNEEDLGSAPNTVKRYLEVLEALYIIFRVDNHHRSIALSLHRLLCLMEDQDGKERSLGYLRTKDGREVDFVLVVEGSPVLQIEVKATDRSISPGLRYFHEHYGIPAVQLVGDLRAENESGPVKLRRRLAGTPWRVASGLKVKDSPSPLCNPVSKDHLDQ